MADPAPRLRAPARVHDVPFNPHSTRRCQARSGSPGRRRTDSTAPQGPLHSASPFHVDNLNTYPVDLDRARRLLEEAGYRPDAHGVRLKVVLD